MKRLSTIFLLGVSPAYAFTALAPRTSLTTAGTAAFRQGNVLLMAPTPRNDPNDNTDTTSLPILDAEMETSSSLSAPKQTRKNLNPTPALVAAWQSLTEGNKNNSNKSAASMAVGLALLLATTFATVDPAWAAMSGGRVGGGGYGRASPSMSRPAPTRSYYGGGSTYGYSRPRTNVFINPGPTIVSPFAPPIISPFAPVVPFSPYGGAGVAISRGPSIFDLFFFAAVALVIANTVRGFGESAAEGVMNQWSDLAGDTPLGSGTTVAQISVALQVPNRDDAQSILRVLPRLAAAANTEQRSGLQNLTSQIALELLRRKSQIVAASTKSQHFRDRAKAQQSFGQRAIQERSKFEKESFSRYRGKDWGNAGAFQQGGLDASGKATMAVVTLLIEIDGDSTKLPNISSMSSVEEALQKIASDSRVGDCLQSAEILWTPEDRSETLTERDVAADYPELRNI